MNIIAKVWIPKRLTVWEDHFFPEIINPETGEALEDGEFGELVFTSLTKEAMPIVRYRTGDLTRLLPGINRRMRRIDRITGRTDDMMIIRGVNVFPTQIEEIILPINALSPHYHCEISRPNRMDELTIVIELKPLISEGAHDNIIKELKARVKSLIGISCNVKLVPPHTLERSSGKAKRIHDFRIKQEKIA